MRSLLHAWVRDSWFNPWSLGWQGRLGAYLGTCAAFVREHRPFSCLCSGTKTPSVV